MIYQLIFYALCVAAFVGYVAYREWQKRRPRQLPERFRYSAVINNAQIEPDTSYKLKLVDAKAYADEVVRKRERMIYRSGE